MSLTDQMNVVEKIIALAGAAGLAFTTFSANTIQNRVNEQSAKLAEVAKQQEIEIARRQEDRAASKEQNELTQEIFKHFVEAITDQTTPAPQRLDRLQGVLVLTYAIPDTRQQLGMAEAVSKAMQRIAAPAEAPRVKEGRFDAEELAVRAGAEQRAAEAPPPSEPVAQDGIHWSNYDFDVFWCDDVPQGAALQERASQILALKALDPKASGTWRPRPLPQLVNQRAGYRVSGYEIRWSSSDELALAQQLKAQIEQKIAGAQVTLRGTSQNTPWYLSVFVCP